MTGVQTCALPIFCRDNDILFVADEVVTGFGRLGRWFASETYELEPDLLLFAKGVTSGYVPLGGVVADRGVWTTFVEADDVFRHGYTYSGHAAACAAGMANLDILEREGLVERVAEFAAPFARALTQLEALDEVTEVRTAGLLAGVQLSTEDPGLPARAVEQARAHGVLTRGLANGSLQISPPFVLSDGELATTVEGLSAAIVAAGRRTPARVAR